MSSCCWVDLVFFICGASLAPHGRIPAKSFGILGMQERAQAFGGVIKINGRPGEGTTVSIKFPAANRPAAPR